MAEMTLSAPQLRRAWSLTLLAALPVVVSLPAFFRMLGAKPGIRMYDPLLAALPSADLSVPLFLFLYAVVLLVVAGLLRHPLRFLRAAQAYVLLLIMRMITMTLFTFDAPPGIVELHDPISTLFYPGQRPFQKDLFFSGHTATIFLFYLAAPWRVGRPLLLVATVLVGLAVLVQHVHWTVDVLAAPVFAWLAWHWAGYTVRWSYPGGARTIA